MYDQMLKETQKNFESVNEILSKKKKEVAEIEAELYKIQGEYRVLLRLSEMDNSKPGKNEEKQIE